ncbi:MAG: factor H binding family protein [Neisseria sp.]|nr:factor H binding family protein [Neisseria sp.]
MMSKKIMMLFKNRPAAAILAAIALSACSGGGSDNNLNLSSGSTANTTGVNAGLTAQQAADKQSTAENSSAFRFTVPTRGNIVNGSGNVVGSSNLSSLTLSVNGKTYDLGTPNLAQNEAYLSPKLADFAKGYGTYSYTLERVMNNRDGETQKGRYKLYNQPYSFVVGRFLDWKKTLSQNGTSSRTTEDSNRQYETEIYYGYGGIAPGRLPQNTTYNYVGKAFDAESEGDLSYNIVFRTDNTGHGSGRITGITTRGNIELKRGNITMNGDEAVISGQAVSSRGNNRNGIYELGIYGPDAAEIAGTATFNDPTVNRLDRKVGFGGVKQ